VRAHGEYHQAFSIAALALGGRAKEHGQCGQRELMLWGGGEQRSNTGVVARNTLRRISNVSFWWTFICVINRF